MSKKQPSPELFDMLHRFLCDYLPIKTTTSPKTIRTYKAALNRFRTYLADKHNISFTDMDFNCFSKNTIYDFLIYLRDDKHASINTLNNRLAAIRTFLRFCSEEDISLTAYYIDIQKIKRFKGEKKPSVDYLTEMQLKLLYSIPNTEKKLERRNRFIMIFLYETGARIDEMLNTRLCDFITVSGKLRLKILGKGNKVRYVPILEDMEKHLRAYLAEFHEDSHENEFLFYTVHNNQHTLMTASNVDSMLKKYASTAQKTESDFPEKLHAHMFRHSIAMAMYKKGIPLSYIRDFLGHESLETVKIYAYADNETIEEALKSVDHASANLSLSQKKWKDKETELLKYCGLS